MARVQVGRAVISVRVRDYRTPIRSDGIALDRDYAACEIRVNGIRVSRVESRVTNRDDLAIAGQFQTVCRNRATATAIDRICVVVGGARLPGDDDLPRPADPDLDVDLAGRARV